MHQQPFLVFMPIAACSLLGVFDACTASHGEVMEEWMHQLKSGSVVTDIRHQRWDARKERSEGCCEMVCWTAARFAFLRTLVTFFPFAAVHASSMRDCCGVF